MRVWCSAFANPPTQLRPLSAPRGITCANSRPRGDTLETAFAMRLRILVAVAAVTALAGALTRAQGPRSGLDVTGFDRAVAPQDDLYRHVNAGWLARVTIPGDRVTYGAFAELLDKTEQDLRAIIEEVAARPNRPRGSAGAADRGSLHQRRRRGAHRAAGRGADPARAGTDRRHPIDARSRGRSRLPFLDRGRRTFGGTWASIRSIRALRSCGSRRGHAPAGS